MAGRRIDDHSSWMGSRGKHSVLPDSAKMMQVKSADGDGAVEYYEDTNDTIVAQQQNGVRHAKGHKMKPGYRY